MAKIHRILQVAEMVEVIMAVEEVAQHSLITIKLLHVVEAHLQTHHI